MGYLANFIVYTLAMVGVIVVALLVFKNATSGGGITKKSKYLKVLDTMSIAPRKTLYVVSAGKERFLIAGDVDKTSLISKLETANEGLDILYPDKVQSQAAVPETPSFRDTMANLPKSNFMDKTNIGIKSSLLNPSGQNVSVMRNLAERIK